MERAITAVEGVQCLCRIGLNCGFSALGLKNIVHRVPWNVAGYIYLYTCVYVYIGCPLIRDTTFCANQKSCGTLELLGGKRLGCRNSAPMVYFDGPCFHPGLQAVTKGY